MIRLKKLADTLSFSKLNLNTFQEVASSATKLDLSRGYGIPARDLRKLDPRLMHPALLVRPGAMLLSLNHVRALVTSQFCLFFGPPSKDVMARLKSKVTETDGLPKELVAIECILQSVQESLDLELKEIEFPVSKVLSYLLLSTSSDHRKYLGDLFLHVQKLTAFKQKITNIRDTLVELLENDEDLANMYLSRKQKKIQNKNHEEVELLLETYLTNIEELVDAAATLELSVKSAERFITLTLDSQRNELLILELKFAMLGVSCCTGALLASLFGMNLVSGLESSKYAFQAAATFSLFLAGTTMSMGIFKIRKVVKIGYSPKKQVDQNLDFRSKYFIDS